MAGPLRRRKRGWWHGAAGWALALALTLPSGELAVPVSQHAGAWALPAEFTGLALALAAAVGFFVVKRHSLLLAAPLSFGLSFSFALALIEGWSAQVKVAIAVAQVALVIGGIVLVIAIVITAGRGLRRLNHARRDIARELGAKLANESLFRDDGERIVVHASRGRMVLRALLTLAILALFVAGYLWARAVVENVVWRIVIDTGIGLVLCFGSLSTLLTLIRLVMTSPTLVVNADGILDNCSMIVTGRGLLRWNETLNVEDFTYSTNKAITYRFLGITVTDPRAINRRQPLWKRMLASVSSQRQFLGFRIPRHLLDRPPAVLAAEIGRYIHAHAPAGSWHKEVTADATERANEK